MAYDLKARCKSCSRFMKIKAVASSEIVVTCTDRKCKADNTIKVVMLSDYVKQHQHQSSYNDNRSKIQDVCL